MPKMFEVASLLSLYFAFALLHAADPRRWPRILPRSIRCASGKMRALAGLSGVAGFWFSSRIHDVTGASLFVLTALAVIATSFVLLVALLPRAMWGLALACPPLVVALALWDVIHG